jgi:cytochrome c oxidase cbb3-type subunit 1
MSTFEGPMMAIKTVNALSHYTDWTIGHVHSGALGWVAMISIGSNYYLIPRLFNKEIYSVKLIELHFWLATVGIAFYIIAMWVGGVLQGLMWRAVNPDGTLTYSFIESVEAMFPFYVVRFLGGVLFLSGMLVMAYNIRKTIAGSKPAEAAVLAPAH